MDEIDRDAAMELLSKDMAVAADPIDDDIGREATTALELLRKGMPSAVELIDEITREAVVVYRNCAGCTRTAPRSGTTSHPSETAITSS